MPYSKLKVMLNQNFWLSLLIFLLTLFTGSVNAQSLFLNELPTGSLAASADRYIEDGRVLSLDEAQALLSKGAFQQNNRSILSEGIGAKPQWLHLEISNPTVATVPMKLVVGTTWTDRIDAYLIQRDQPTVRWQTGDTFHDANGLTPGIGYTLALNFAPGRSDLYLRVESVDPLVFPVELLTEAQAANQQMLVHYSYGFLFGFLVALAAYNVTLFAGLRRRSYLYYALYLASFITLVACYSGHGSALFWSDQPQIQRYIILIMMVVYCCCGLLFACQFLALKEYSPRTFLFVQRYAALGLGSIALSVLLGSQPIAVVVAFTVMATFSLWMVYLSIHTIRVRQVSGRYFFIAALFGMIGTATTTLAVLGWTPFNTWTFHAIELGVVIEATLFALAITYHFNELSDNLAKINALNAALSLEIAERKEAEQDLRIAATAFESQEGMFVTDANSIILRVNQTFTKITGYSAEDFIGQKIQRMLSTDRKNRHFYATVWEHVNNTGTWTGDVWSRRKSGEVYPGHLTITAVRDAAGVVSNHVGIFIDITKNKAASEVIIKLAYYDPLTHLPNRRLLIDRLNQGLATSARSHQRGAILFLDLDHFKALNDTLGHDMGDLLLQQVATRLTASVRDGDTVARIGGDEFVLLLEGLGENEVEAAAQTKDIAEKIITVLNQPYQLNENTYQSTPSIGATLFNGHELATDELLQQADIAMYQSKTEGRNTLQFFDHTMQVAITVRADLECELRKAIEQQQFQLHYQMQVGSNGKPFGAEVLIRWYHPERGMISPLSFIPLAEETGLILPIGQWVLDTACDQLSKWQRDPRTSDVVLAVNVSAKQFQQVDFVEQVKATMQRNGINPALLKLELTESMLVDNIDDIITKMNALSKLGIQFSLDDFGTGYSSLQYIKTLPLNQLKIDQSFVRDIVTDTSDRAIVCTIITMAHSLGINVIAEGVEVAEQRQCLLDNGCLHFQGYLFSKPVPIEEFEVLLRNGWFMDVLA